MAAVVLPERDANGMLPAFTSFGCYTIIYITSDGLTVCAPCASKDDTSDDVINCGTYDEGPTLDCDDCGEPIESSYGDPETTEE